MKTKNILLSALALAIFAAPAFAQNWDYHDLENLDLAQHVSDTIKTPVKASVPQKKYLDISYLRDCISQDLSYSPEDLAERAKNSIKDKKIAANEQEELINLCIMYNNADILEILLKAGFSRKGTIEQTENKVITCVVNVPDHGSKTNKNAAEVPTDNLKPPYHGSKSNHSAD